MLASSSIQTHLTLTTLSVHLFCSEAQLDLAEALLWTVEGVDTVQVRLGVSQGEEYFSHLEVYTQLPEAVETLQAKCTQDEVWQSCGLAVTEITTLEAKDWEHAWKEHWHPQAITDRLWITPSWEASPLHKENTPGVNPNENNTDVFEIVLDPGCAFGTGTHPTTRLMLRELERVLDTFSTEERASLKVLDIGTGSGILAIYAALRGCAHGVGTDIDPVAVQAAQENIARNALAPEITMHISAESLPELHARYGTHRFSLMLANILGPVIVELLPEMVKLLQPGGTLLCSGIVESHRPALMAAFAQHHLTVKHWQQEGDWFLVTCHKHEG